MKVAFVALLLALPAIVEARQWAPRAAEPPPIAVTCEDVRRAVALVGLDAARSQARQLGMTRSQERRAARCLRTEEG
jgi:hypothetical protein